MFKFFIIMKRLIKKLRLNHLGSDRRNPLKAMDRMADIAMEYYLIKI
jgi:hypothetical protein